MEGIPIIEISKIEQIVANSGFKDAFATASPNDSDFPAAISALLRLAGEKLHQEIVNLIPDCDSLIVYRNVIAISMGSPFLLSAIARATLCADNNDVKSLHGSLSEILKKAAKSDPGLRWIYDPTNEEKPAIPTSCYFTSSLRLRYSLAGSSRKIRAESWVRSVPKHPGCSRLAAQRELHRALRHAEEAGATIKPMSVAVLYSLPITLQILITSDSLLSKTFISSRANIPEIATQVAKSWKARKVARGKLRQICGLISDRQFRKAEKVVSTLPVEAIDGPLREEFSRLVLKRLDAPSKAALDVKWHPMGPELRRVLYILTGKRFRSSVLSLESHEIVLKASKTKLYPKQISRIDLARFKKHLAKSHLLLLASKGRFDLAEAISQRAALPYLEQLSDTYSSHEAARDLLEILVEDYPRQCIKQAIPLLQQKDVSALRRCIRFCDESSSRQTWRKALLPYLGTQAAQGTLVPDSATVLDAFKASRSKKLIVDQQAFHNQLSDWLYRLIYFELTGHSEGSSLRNSYFEIEDSSLGEVLEFAKTYQKINPDFTQLLANRLGVENISRLITQEWKNDQFVLLLESHIQDQKGQRQLRLARLKLSGKPGKFLSELRKDAGFSGVLTPEFLKTISLDSGGDSRALQILCLRRSPRKLQLYLKRFDWRTSKRSLLRSAGFLELTSRDRGYMELVAALGPVYIRTIAAILARIDPGKPAGRKLDGDYKTYKLPKKSGGNRTVSVPSPVLKRVQRGILYSLLNPLGSHAASYGFVKGRSIRGNAERHIGQEVVVNCDVSNCFPSVSWSLVLGAVRRDLGVHLSPAAISLIVDICTARGGLPIGAPTSPLLLNRVLLRTDEILTKASIDRRCIYSRYADDLTFSGDGRAVELLGVAKGTLTRIGLELDPKKTNIFRRGRRQIVNGLTVNEQANVPRRIRRRLRAALHRAEQGHNMHWHGQEMNMSSLRGRIGFVDSINADSGKPMLSRLQRIEKKYDG
jgi:Reverse transcriptase (RNA-dependent DNA polymerase)